MNQSDLINLIPKLEPGQILVIESEAGSGKTWTAMKAISQLDSNINVAIVAPTHDALGELQDKLADFNPVCDVRFFTSASYAGRILHFSKSSGNLENMYLGSSRQFDLVVMDEISATPSYDLKNVCRSKGAVVLLGDRHQLNPVMSSSPFVWTDEVDEYLEAKPDKSISYVTIHGQRRNTGAIHRWAQLCNKTGQVPTVSEESIPVFYDWDSWIEDYLAKLRHAHLTGLDLKQYVYLAYRNFKVWQIRDLVRTQVFKSDNFVPGESVRVESWPHSKTSGYKTGRILKVQSATDTYVEIGLNRVKLSKIQFEGDESSYLVQHPSDLGFTEMMTRLKEDKDWDLFFKFQDLVGCVANANVMTVNKSQGKSISHVWCDLWDIGNRKRYKYVSIGRAVNRLAVPCNHEHHKSLKGRLPELLELQAKFK